MSHSQSCAVQRLTGSAPRVKYSCRTVEMMKNLFKNGCFVFPPTPPNMFLVKLHVGLRRGGRYGLIDECNRVCVCVHRTHLCITSKLCRNSEDLRQQFWFIYYSISISVCQTVSEVFVFYDFFFLITSSICCLSPGGFSTRSSTTCYRLFSSGRQTHS